MLLGGGELYLTDNRIPGIEFRKLDWIIHSIQISVANVYQLISELVSTPFL